MSSAQRDLLPLDDPASEMEAERPFALKEQVAERIAAHRARRGTHAANPVTPIARPSNSRSARIAAAVAERYAHSQSYRAFLAAQAETAIREAEAAADVAALSAQAVADAQYQLLAELDQWSLTPPEPPTATPVATRPGPPTWDPAASAPAISGSSQSISTQPNSAQPSSIAPSQNSGLTVRIYEDGAHKLPSAPTAPVHTQSGPSTQASVLAQPLDETEALALDEEIAFRQSPVFEESTPPIDIPANLIEFPRQLVAARKARPRLAEGPLREDADHAPHSPQTAQLRIFEVEANQISTAPAVESVHAEWSSILLAAHPVTAHVETPDAPFIPLFAPQTAPISLRIMAAIVDACIVLASFLLFTAAFAVTVGKLDHTAIGRPHLTLQVAAITSIATVAVFALLYQFLFFTFSDATPGMRYARIGLCTFTDDNPTRSAMRRRILAMLLSACPLGIGFLWAWMDEDGLGWHDRISRIYQRAY